MTLLWVLLAGGLGASARYAVTRALGDDRPWGTLAVNVTGCLAAGLVAGAAGPTGAAREVALAGLAGGYTTFSTYAVEIVRLDASSRAGAAAYALGSVVLGVLAAALGLAISG